MSREIVKEVLALIEEFTPTEELGRLTYRRRNCAEKISGFVERLLAQERGKAFRLGQLQVLGTISALESGGKQACFIHQDFDVSSQEENNAVLETILERREKGLLTAEREKVREINIDLLSAGSLKTMDVRVSGFALSIRTLCFNGKYISANSTSLKTL